MRMLNPVHPGRFLRTEVIDGHNLSVTESAKLLRVSRPTLSSLLNLGGIPLIFRFKSSESAAQVKTWCSRQRLSWSGGEL